MSTLEVWLRDSLRSGLPGAADVVARDSGLFVAGGLFLEPAVPPAFVSSVSVRWSSVPVSKLCCSGGRGVVVSGCGKRRAKGGGFLSVSLSVKEEGGFASESAGLLEQNGEKGNPSEEETLEGVAQTGEKEKFAVHGAGASAMNTTKHLWAGAVAAMVSRNHVRKRSRVFYGSQHFDVLVNPLTMKSDSVFNAWLRVPDWLYWTELVRNQGLTRCTHLLLPPLRISDHVGGRESSFSCWIPVWTFPAAAPSSPGSFWNWDEAVMEEMITKTFVAPLERLKLEYIVRGEQKNLFELIKAIATSQGLKGFWKGNFVNILRTAPFKAVNFYAYDTYRKQLLKMSGNEETTNFERFVAGAAAGITATILCIPMDTIRTKMVAPGGEALGGVIGVFSHMVQTEGFFSLYKGLVPSIISMAPSGAVFYGVYDILKSAYLHSPEGRRRRMFLMKKHGDGELNALDKLELGPMRTLLYGAISGCCAEAATYPFEVVRRHLQMQVQATRLSAFATCCKIVEQGGVPALYAGLIPSLLQVLPSAAISYFVYEFMKIVLKVE
ncbi:hypothetical protein Taro_012493 [Colocasia esculenta]|uniref:Mitochondrial adenine nucleotide transporter BTL3 n=1 Tax=Colocasia esculenta TaxID=4460 RepID=A0A843UJB8_COLES|nr:hypothetical protein [Colocasia esculenta]